MGLALTRTPVEVQVYVIDLGGGTFSTMLDLPHLAGVATRDEPDVVARIMAEVSALLDDRERFFKANRIDSIQTYRHERAAGRLDDGYGDVFLIIDGWSTLKTDFEDISTRIMAIAPRALALGVHVVVATGRWTDMRMTIKDMFATRIELRLGDPADSEINRKIAREVPTGRPGRGLDPGARHMLLALPRTDDDHDPATLARGANDACRAIAEAWTGPQGPKLRLLPTRIDLATLQEQVPPGGAPVIGINEARLEPVRLDMSHDPHFIVLGMPRPVGGASRAMFEPITQTLSDLSTPGIMLPGSPDEGPLLGRQKPIPEPPGRARLISRDHGVQSLQLAWAPPTR